MKIELTAPVSDDHVAGSPSDERAVRRASIYDKKAFTIEHEARSHAALDALYKIAKKHGERGLMMQLTSPRNVLAAPATSKLGNLKTLEPGLITRQQHDCIAIERPNFELLATERYDYRDCLKPLVAEGV